MFFSNHAGEPALDKLNGRLCRRAIFVGESFSGIRAGHVDWNRAAQVFGKRPALLFDHIQRWRWRHDA